jgi:Alpha/beta hydrolase family
MAQSSPRILFLHGGPGFTAELERRQFGDSLPVHWWDQPHFDVHDSAPYARLVRAALEELDRLYSQERRPIGLVANSFGAHLALALMRAVPEKIGPSSIVGGVLDVRTAFVRLARRIVQANGDEGLMAASDAVEQRRDFGTLWKLVERLLTVPNLLDFYWSPTATRQLNAMKSLLASGRLLHVLTFHTVLQHFLSMDAMVGPPPWRGPLQVCIGRDDPFYVPEDTSPWRTLLPSASLKVVDAGHFPHLELSPSEWLLLP